jgi:hypothetical protein
MVLDARTLISNSYCLQEISKDLQGEVTVLDRIQKTCGNPTCDTLTLIQHVHLVQNPAQCDSELGRVLNGEIQVLNLTTVFTGLQEILRGVHAADFYWKPSAGGSIGPGTLQGITNAGIVRPPAARQECERCLEVGILTGHLFAPGTRVPGIPVPDFYVDAVYRLAWDPIAQVRQTAPVRGTLEGVILMPCQ